jgi:hypothetical protein
MVEVLPRKKALGPAPDLPSGQRPQPRGWQGMAAIPLLADYDSKLFRYRKQKTLEPVVLENVQAGAEIHTDGWNGYDNLFKLGCNHIAASIQGDQA